jgi:hypothetical protein
MSKDSEPSVLVDDSEKNVVELSPELNNFLDSETALITGTMDQSFIYPDTVCYLQASGLGNEKFGSPPG